MASRSLCSFLYKFAESAKTVVTEHWHFLAGELVGLEDMPGELIGLETLTASWLEAL